jgi:hypothetical protein
MNTKRNRIATSTLSLKERILDQRGKRTKLACQAASLNSQGHNRLPSGRTAASIGFWSCPAVSTTERRNVISRQSQQGLRRLPTRRACCSWRLSHTVPQTVGQPASYRDRLDLRPFPFISKETQRQSRSSSRSYSSSKARAPDSSPCSQLTKTAPGDNPWRYERLRVNVASEKRMSY